MNFVQPRLFQPYAGSSILFKYESEHLIGQRAIWGVLIIIIK